MSERPGSGKEYSQAHDLMCVMVENSQRPGEGNHDFVAALGDYADGMGFNTRRIPDPRYDDRSLLVVDVGDPDGEQSLVAVSHSDVVGVEGQQWDMDPWTVHEDNDTWFGRGVCDTHGSGVAMLLAGARPTIVSELERTASRISIIFTYDEEAQAADLSYRGIRMAGGLIGSPSIITAPYYIAGEPTEFDGEMVAMRSHKGRWLAHYILRAAHSGHAADIVQNAFTEGCEVVHEIGRYAAHMREIQRDTETKESFAPPYSTVQITAATVKGEDFSTTPDYARFTVDMRTLPVEHEQRVQDMIALIRAVKFDTGIELELELIDEFPGTITPVNSPIVNAAEAITGKSARGFSGGDEGGVLRSLGKEGITLGPGELRCAHMPNEQIAISSVMGAVNTYGYLFSKIGASRGEHNV